MKKILLPILIGTSFSVPFMKNINYSIEEMNKTSNINNRKENINSIKPKPIRVDLSLAKPEEVLTYVMVELMSQNSDIPIISDIAMSILYETDNWTLLNFNEEIPNPGKEETYLIKAFAKPTNPDYIGIFEFEATYFNDYSYENIIIENNSPNIADTTLNDQTEYKATLGSIIEVNILDYAPTLEEFLKYYNKIEINVDFKHEDNASLGKGIIASTLVDDIDVQGIDNEPVKITVSLSELIKKENFSYEDVSNAEDLFNNFGNKNPLDNSLLVDKEVYSYRQNETKRLIALDVKFNNNTFYIRSISCAGKYGHWANAANVHSKVTSWIPTVEFPVKK